MKYLFLISLFSILLSCKTEVGDSSAKFKSLVPTGEGGSKAYAPARDILVNKCGTCHYHADYPGLSEENWSSHAHINLGDPNSSPLIERTKNGGGMPQNAPALSEDEQSILRAWVSEMAGSGSPSGGTGGPIVEDTSEEFREAYPVIYENCVPCHAAANSNNITSFEFPSQKGWASSGLITSKDALGSLLFQRIQDGSMPPDPISKTISQSDVAKIETWINSFEFSNNPVTTTTTGSTTGGMNGAQRMQQAKALLQGRCAGCHGNSGGFSFGTLLGAGATYADWDAAMAPGGQQLFEPGNPNGSRIFVVLRGSGQQPADMPVNAGQAFNETEIGQLRNWIIMANQP